MTCFSSSLPKNQAALKAALPAEDILSFPFFTADGVACLLVYADGLVNKQLLGELAISPLQHARLHTQKTENDGGRDALNAKTVAKYLLFPETKEVQTVQEAGQEILDGNAAIFLDGMPAALIVGAKMPPTRAVAEPPTDVAVKGPREGFIEDVKVNMSLLRKRLKTPNLRLEVTRVGKQSQTAVCLCYLDGIAKAGLKEELERKLTQIDLDAVPDSSYIATLLSGRQHSVFRSVGTTERPDVFAAKLTEGRVGILVDGSPIALTLPFLAIEDFQSNEDYYVSPVMATIFRTLRLISVLVALLTPALYVCTQLFKMQLLPLGLTLTIAESTSRLPLSPSLETFVVLFVLEVLKEASIRMPKYVGMSLSVVGALVLGEAAVSAGFLSTPTIIVVALSGICLYTVPNFVETGSILRWLFLLVAGSFGPFGLTLAVAFVLYYMITADNFSTPLLSPFAPLNRHDWKDSIAKYDLTELSTRPQILRSNNKTRLKVTRKKS